MKLKYIGSLPSTNDLIQLNRTNRFAGASMKRKYTQELATVFGNQSKTRYKGHVTVSVDFYESTLRRDDDNVLSGLKYILDGLVTAGIIHDDSPKWCHVIAERHQSKFEIDGKKIAYIDVEIEPSNVEDYL